MRKCNRCGKDKSLSQFRESKPGYRRKTCNECMDLAHGQWLVSRHARLLNQAFVAYGDYKDPVCSCCGVSERDCLLVDWVDIPSSELGREVTISTLDRRENRLLKWVEYHDYPTGIAMVLCANCVVGRRLNNGICPHEVR